MKKIKLIPAVLAIFAASLFAGACSMNSSSSTRWHNKPTTSNAGNVKPVETVGVVTNIDEENKIISFIAAEDGSPNIFPYGAGTMVYSKSGVDISMSQITPGMVLDIFYNGNTKLIEKLKISDNKNVWENKKVTSFSVDDSKRSMRVGQTLYSYNENTFVYSDGDRISMMELNSQDQLVVRGYGTKVLSVVVDKGHGYISLTGDSLFIGGYIDVGGTVVKVIEENMLLIVREGNYKVEVRNGEYLAERQVTVERNENCKVDFSDVVPNVTRNGNLRFNINVPNARLYINDVETDYTGIVVLPAGKYKIAVIADGYKPYSRDIDVEVTYQVINVNLKANNAETGADKETETAGEETTTGENETTKPEQETTARPGQDIVSKINDVTVSGPVGGYVYFDGIYKGTAPVTFDMITGEHVISILYHGEINSYSVVLAEGGDDVVYDFTGKKQ